MKTVKPQLAALLLLAACAMDTAQAVATFDEVKRDFKPSDTLVLDRNGEVLQRLRTDSAVRRGQWVALPDVSPALRTALVLSEDKRFYEHSGVDWRAVSSAAWGNLWNTKTRGASTISMQLAGLIDEDWRAGAGGRSLTQKVGQTVSAQYPGGALAQGPDPRGLPEPRALSRRDGGHRCAQPHAVRQGRAWAGRA
jgi:penicillin-binding protein 1C